MPVTNKKSDLYRDYQLGEAFPDPVLTKGRAVYTTGSVANAADDSLGSSFLLCELPSDCLLHPDTSFDVEAWGFAQIVIGTKADTTALVNQTKATENIVTPIAFGDANHGNRLWEVLGLAADPGGYIALYAHAAANATGAGTMLFQIASIQH